MLWKRHISPFRSSGFTSCSWFWFGSVFTVLDFVTRQDSCCIEYSSREKGSSIHCRGILVKLVICVVPGHWKIKILNLKKRNKFICFFMFLYPIQGGKNIGSPYLTNKSWFFGKSDVPGQQNKSYIGVMASKNLIFLMFWLSFVYL